MEIGWCLGLSLEAKAAYDKRILELEKENTELLEKVERLQAEWDAAMDVLRGQRCDTCEYRDIDTREEPCRSCRDGDRWQWIGIQKKEE